MSKLEEISLKTFVKLLRASNSVSEDVHKHLKDYGLTVSQFGVLEAIYHLGSMSQSDIAKKILKSEANIVTVIDNLEKRGFIKRVKNEKDRRYINIVLTDKGKTLIEIIFPQHKKIVAERFSCLSEEEILLLGDLCRKLGKNMPK
jgi:MarR family 2-MHQ and catechol resistance regulon transcriptional repressor